MSEDEELLERFEKAMDAVTATGNLSIAAADLFLTARTLSRDEDHLVLLVDADKWLDMKGHLDMFLAVADMIEDENPEEYAEWLREQGEQDG